MFGEIAPLVDIVKNLIFFFLKLKNNKKNQKQTSLPHKPPSAWCHRQESKGH